MSNAITWNPTLDDMDREIKWLTTTATNLYNAYIDPGGYDLLDESNITVGAHNDCVKRAFQLSTQKRMRQGLPPY